ncbi:urease accessory UreF family protein [Bosea sp. 117]|uniref:urease accessory protein UreF n=1 Tax=Bosea sp. 117 TaxID=1125973 RepID=UPI000493E069|nr:urease accessory UreF family protein [Bosea sp. 117]
MIGQLLAIWQADTAFPSGGFAFSNGLEGLAALSGPIDEMELENVVANALRRRWASADRVALARAYRVADDLDRVEAIDREVEASTLAEPFRLGSRRNGASLIAAHARIGTPGAREFQGRVRQGRALGHLPVAQGVLWRGAGLDAASAMLASGYVALSGFTTAAVRLGLLGAVSAQGIVRRLLPLLAELAAAPLPSRIESFSPRLDIAAMRHARGEVRLFSN